jgi:hypothetical protein
MGSSIKVSFYLFAILRLFSSAFFHCSIVYRREEKYIQNFGWEGWTEGTVQKT